MKRYAVWKLDSPEVIERFNNEIEIESFLAKYTGDLNITGVCSYIDRDKGFSTRWSMMANEYIEGGRVVKKKEV